ncbi:hypothetical protein [Facilibium subflavum]|uniref:hypothetical protein n=1 Tax=Facilibium subflavum TaxID=2219058 RepID=UPI000E6575CB|nr:hypothetical protein [Facilibium subflavum]
MKFYNLINKLMMSILIFATALALISCSGSSSPSSSTPTTQEPITILADDTVLQGKSTVISVSLNASFEGKGLQVGATAAQAKNIRFHFLDQQNNDKFTVSYSENCDLLSGTQVCLITVTPQSSAINLVDSKIGYIITAIVNDKQSTSKNRFFTLKRLSTSFDSLGVDASKTIGTMCY